tara:strand:- start:261 stop:1247 length:987 start_codon:yes stop_codon:yes gene_type:complete
MKIIYLPLEHIESRYTAALDRDIVKYLEFMKKDFIRIYPDIETPTEMKAGSFLDAEFTIRFKAEQIAEVARLYREDVINTGDIIWSSDLWHPGLPESIAYMNYFTNKDVKLRGLIHAGSFTDTDFVRDMERWAKNFEDILFDVSDRIFCGSNFIKNDIIKKRLIQPDKLEVTGFPLDLVTLDKYRKKHKKENIVLFSARNVDEKQPWLFKQMKKRIQSKIQCEFINTQELNLNKDEFYELIAKSKVMVSFALQENFGFSMLEAKYLGCKVVVPNRLVYPELYNSSDLYTTFDEACDMVYNNITGWNSEFGYFDNNQTFHDCFEKWFRS